MKKLLLTLLAAYTVSVQAQENARPGGVDVATDKAPAQGAIKKIETDNQSTSKSFNPVVTEDRSVKPLSASAKSEAAQYFNDVIIENSTSDQRGVRISAAFNGWLFAAYSTSNSASNVGGMTFRRSKDNGVTWSTLYTYTVTGVSYKTFDIVVAGTDTNNLVLFHAGVNNNVSGGTYTLFYDKFNGRTGAYLGTFGSAVSYGTRKVYDISIASDYKFPAVGASPYSVGVLYSVFSSLDSVIFVASLNGGTSMSVRQPLYSTSAYCRHVSLDYGRSASWSNGRYFATWERCASSTARNANIYMSRNATTINGTWIAPKNLDSLNASTLGMARNPDIAVQHNNLDNDSSGVTALVVFERDYTGTGSDYDVLGFHNKRATSSSYWKYFQIVNTTEKDNQPDMVYDPANNNFLAVYHDSTNHKLPYCINGFNMTNPSTWGYITGQYNDLTTNIVNPWPRVDINPAVVKTVHVWNSEGAAGKGIALFDAENLYTSVKEVTEGTISSDVYPNPATSEINIKFELKNTQDVTMSVYDMQGRIVKHEVYNSLGNGATIKTIDIADLTQGVYVLKLSSDKVVFSKKFVKSSN